MSVQKEKNKKSKKTVNTKKKNKSIEKPRNFNLWLVVTFLTGVLLIISTYAWFSASLDVRIRFFDMTVATDTGIFISLDGIDFSSSIVVSDDSVIYDLKSTYPNHTNQWPSGGLWPVSSNGIRNSNSNKFDMFAGSVRGYKGRRRTDITNLNTFLIPENQSNANNLFVAFDLFMKNVSNSPFNDNLYFDEGTLIDFEEDTPDDIIESMSGIMNSMRIGVVRIGSVSSDSDINTIQNLACNNNCEMVIYEPNSTSHSEVSIERAMEYYGITLVDGVYTPTYAVINEGENLDLASGHPESGIPLDTEHFALQETITHFRNPIFQIPHGITKFRVYVWIEGQDIDSLETNSDGAAIYAAINFAKDLAGYQ